jgi:hypothetical protein
MAQSSTPSNGHNGVHAISRRPTEQPLSPESFREELHRVAGSYAAGQYAFHERRARLPDTLRALATVLREAATVLSRVGVPAEIERLPSPRPLEKGMVLRVAGATPERDGEGAPIPAEQPAQLRIEVRPDARLQIVWVGHALVGEVARELVRDDPRAPSEVGVLSFKREVVRFLDAALGSSFRAG